MPPRRHVTPRMIAANRANARRSTGPRTPEGKARSRANSLVHGLRAAVLAPPLLETAEDHAAFDDLLAALRAELEPAGADEELLILTLAESCFGLRRALRVEAAALVAAARVQKEKGASEASLHASSCVRHEPIPPAGGEAAKGGTVGGQPGDGSPTLPIRIMSAIFRYEAPLRHRVRQSIRALRRIQAQRRRLAQLDPLAARLIAADRPVAERHEPARPQAGPMPPAHEGDARKAKSPREPNLHPSSRVPAAPDPIASVAAPPTGPIPPGRGNGRGSSRASQAGPLPPCGANGGRSPARGGNGTGSRPRRERQGGVGKAKSPSEPNLHPSLRIPAAPNPLPPVGAPRASPVPP